MAWIESGRAEVALDATNRNITERKQAEQRDARRSSVHRKNATGPELYPEVAEVIIVVLD